MANENATGQEAAVQSSTPTPEQIAAAMAILSAAQQVATPTSSDVTEDSSLLEESVSSTTQGNSADTVTIDQLRIAFEAAMSSEVYLGNPKRLTRLLESLKIPMANEKDYNQFLNHALKDLKAKATDLSVATGKPAVMPTDEEVIAEAKRRLAAKLQREQEKAAQKTK